MKKIKELWKLWRWECEKNKFALVIFWIIGCNLFLYASKSEYKKFLLFILVFTATFAAAKLYFGGFYITDKYGVYGGFDEYQNWVFKEGNFRTRPPDNIKHRFRALSRRETWHIKSDESEWYELNLKYRFISFVIALLCSITTVLTLT